jgi:hypothetical protein
MSWIDKLGGRKFIMSFTVEILTFIALLTSKIDGQTFLIATGLITGLYQTTNTIAKFSPEATIYAESDTGIVFEKD